MIGGGSGLSVVLRGLKGRLEAPGADHLTAVVTVADDGGSSGRLRRELGVLPPGDIRNCIVALADDEDLLARLFQYRFPNAGSSGISGHSFGNLFLTALTGITGDFYQAILTAESILSVRGRILPATLTDVRLRGVGRSGRIYQGESAVGRSGERLSALEIEPPNAPAFPPAVAALEEADLIVLGPGSLYTSVLCNLLIPGIRNALDRSSALVVLVLNLMTQPGETDRMDAPAHMAAIRELAGEGLVDSILINAAPPPAGLLATYADTGSEFIQACSETLAEWGVEVIETDLLADDLELVRHDPDKLSRAILDLAERSSGSRPPAAELL